MIIIFDFDGTLANTREVLMAIYNQLAEKHGFRQVTMKDFAELRQQGYLSVLRWTQVHLWQLPKLISEGRRLLSTRSADIKLFPGIKEIILKLHSQGHTCYVLSSNTPRIVKKVMRTSQLDFMKVLPAASLFGKAATIKTLKKTHPNQQVIMVGDEVRDIHAAQKANAKVIAVTWGFQAADILKAEKPDALANKPEDILTYIGKV